MWDLYSEHRFYRLYGGPGRYDEMTAHKADWFMQFEALDHEIENALLEKARHDAERKVRRN